MINARRMFVALALGTLGACMHSRGPASSDVQGFDRQPLEFVGMGTVWKVWIQSPTDRSVSKKILAEDLSQEVQKLDVTFSEWNKKSELRSLEQRGLDKFQSPSREFMTALRWAQDFHRLTDGTFDITVGAVLWKARSAPVGQAQLEIDGQKFRFRTDPQRLSFGGFIKGAAVGRLAQKLRNSGIEVFRVDAGGGNLIERHASGDMTLISRSASHQGKNQHIINPQNPNQKLSQTVVLECVYTAKDREPASGTAPDWAYESAKVDALTKALLIRPELTSLPQNCEVKFRQEQS